VLGGLHVHGHQLGRGVPDFGGAGTPSRSLGTGVFEHSLVFGRDEEGRWLSIKPTLMAIFCC